MGVSTTSSPDGGPPHVSKERRLARLAKVDTMARQAGLLGLRLIAAAAAVEPAMARKVLLPPGKADRQVPGSQMSKV